LIMSQTRSYTSNSNSNSILSAEDEFSNKTMQFLHVEVEPVRKKRKKRRAVTINKNYLVVHSLQNRGNIDSEAIVELMSDEHNDVWLKGLQLYLEEQLPNIDSTPEQSNSSRIVYQKQNVTKCIQNSEQKKINLQAKIIESQRKISYLKAEIQKLETIQLQNE